MQVRAAKLRADDAKATAGELKKARDKAASDLAAWQLVADVIAAEKAKSEAIQLGADHRKTSIDTTGWPLERAIDSGEVTVGERREIEREDETRTLEISAAPVRSSRKNRSTWSGLPNDVCDNSLIATMPAGSWAS